jgi:peptidoglycan/xylan/chitin deacetylase (PgdA/CDA1 family)
MNLLKAAFFGASSVTGFEYFLMFMNRRKLLTLCWHSVAAPAEEADDCGASSPPTSACDCFLATSQRAFRAQLDLLRRRFRPVSARDVLLWLQGKRTLPRNAVFITIDDGFRSALTYMAPELGRYEMPALLNVTTGYVGTDRILWTQLLWEGIRHWPFRYVPSPNGTAKIELPVVIGERCRIAKTIIDSAKLLEEPALREYLRVISQELPGGILAQLRKRSSFLNWDEVRTLHRHGIDIGSHGVEHLAFSRLPPDRLRHELEDSKRTIETHIDAECCYVAYPFGGREHVNEGVAAAARTVGYRAGLTGFGSGLSARGNPYMLGRAFVMGNEDQVMFRARVSGLHGIVQRLK